MIKRSPTKARMETTEIKCDQCDVDLTYTENCEDYRLVLGSQSKSPWYAREGLRGGALTSMAIAPMAIAPPVDRTHHFCGLSCLAMWMQPKMDDLTERYTKMLKHRAWLAEKNAERKAE